MCGQLGRPVRESDSLSDGSNSNKTNMNRIALLVCMFLTYSEASDAQPGQTQGSNLVWLLKSTGSCRASQTGKMSCVAVLSAPMTTKRNRPGDHISLNTYSASQGLTRLEATIVEVQTGVNGRSSLRIQIGKGEAVDGHELSVEARIVAVVSPSKVAERWDASLIVVDRFPRAPESDQRQPGERTLSEDPPHVSSVDSALELPGFSANCLFWESEAACNKHVY
jgi:hypothetical protein